MKKTTKKSAPKASHKKAVKDLGVEPAKAATVRGGTLIGPGTPVGPGGRR